MRSSTIGENLEGIPSNGISTSETNTQEEAADDGYRRALQLLNKYKENGSLPINELTMLYNYWKGFGRSSEGREKALELQTYAYENEVNVKALLTTFSKMDKGMNREETSKQGYIA